MLHALLRWELEHIIQCGWLGRKLLSKRSLFNCHMQTSDMINSNIATTHA